MTASSMPSAIGCLLISARDLRSEHGPTTTLNGIVACAPSLTPQSDFCPLRTKKSSILSDLATLNDALSIQARRETPPV